MTKAIKRILLAGLAIALLATMAFAAMTPTPLNGATLTANNDGTYTAALSGATGGTKGYALLVVSVDKDLAAQIKAGTATGGWTISDDTVLFIDQNDTAASFTFKPMANKTSVVLLGGTEPSPTILGVLESKGLPGDVNGDSNINAQDRTLLAHYTSHWTAAQDARLTTNADTIQLNGDLTGEGSINAQDRTLLAHHTAHWTAAQDSRLTAYWALIGQ